jgi:hypothetical protein
MEAGHPLKAAPRPGKRSQCRLVFVVESLPPQLLRRLPLLVCSLRFGLPALPSAVQLAGSGNTATFATSAKTVFASNIPPPAPPVVLRMLYQPFSRLHKPQFGCGIILQIMG